MDEPARNTLTGKACLAFAAAIALGVLLAWWVSPYIFRALPTDLTRTRVLLDALAQPGDTPPRIVAFGNSVGMATLDMKSLSASLPDKPPAWNLTSTGQAPMESYLYYQQLPDSVSVIIQMVNINALRNLSVLDAQKYNAFYMYGYRPDERTIAAMSTILGDEMASLFEKSDLLQRFGSRWAVRQMADRFARGLLRQDLELETGTYDLYFPSTYTQRLPDAQFERSIRDKYDYNLSPRLKVNPQELAMLGELIDRANAQNIRVILLFQPLHPALFEYSGAEYLDDARREVAEFASSMNAIPLDAISLIPGDEYVDASHPSTAGAKRLGDWLAARLSQLREDGELDY